MIKIAVSDFAQPLEPRGGLTFSVGRGRWAEIGIEIHKEKQKANQQALGYQAELPLSSTFSSQSMDVHVHGRADGVFFEENSIVVEEIKSCFSVRRLKRELGRYSDHKFKLQVQTYAYLLAKKYSIPIKCRLLLVSLINRDEIAVEVTFCQDQFEDFFEERLKQVILAEMHRQKNIGRRKQNGKKMNFPFEPRRKYQTELIETVEDGVGNNSQMLLQAPTGIGKTAGVLFR